MDRSTPLKTLPIPNERKVKTTDDTAKISSESDVKSKPVPKPTQCIPAESVYAEKQVQTPAENAVADLKNEQICRQAD